MPIEKYGRRFETNSPIDVELWAFRERLTVEQGGLGGAKHFENLVREFWPWFVWHEDAYEQAQVICDYDITGFTAGASNTKSDILGKFGLCSWWSDPLNTLVITCSTTAMDSKQKIWGHMIRDFRSVSAAGKGVGKLIESLNIIRLTEKSDGIGSSDNASICLVAAGNEFTEDALKRLQGRKQKHVILILDELQDCSQTIIDAAYWNLSANERLSIHAAGNASSRMDPHGKFMTPVDGWTQVNRTTRKWFIKVGTKVGVGLHMDCTVDTSPNMRRYLNGQPQLGFMRKAEDIIAAKDLLGESNPAYMRQFVGFWPDSESETNYLITEQEVVSHHANEKMYWQSSPTDYAGLDPSYSAGGDRFIAYHLQYGLSTEGIWTVFFKEYTTIKVVPRPGETKDFAAVRLSREWAEKRRITPRNIGSDASAATSFMSILHSQWSQDILPVPFGGAATDLAISFYDRRIAKDIYADRSTELLGVLHEFIIHGQVRGLDAQHIKECTSRQFKHVGNRIKLESKEEMKKRLGYSPDVMDGGNIGLAVIRERMKAMAGGESTSGAAGGQSEDWKRLQKKNDVASRSNQARRLALRGV